MNNKENELNGGMEFEIRNNELCETLEYEMSYGKRMAGDNDLLITNNSP